MYLKGSKWTVRKRTKRANPWRVMALLVFLGVALYINQVIVPTVPPLFIPTPTPTRSPESFVSDADALLGQGKMLQAIQAYKLAIQADPKNPTNYLTIARLLVWTGSYAEALTNAENALLLNTNHSMANAIRGWALAYTGELLPGEASEKRAIELDPNNGIAYAYLAEILTMQITAGEDTINTRDRAVEASRMAMQLTPNTLEAHRARGIVLEITGNYPEAAAEFEAALVFNNTIADLHLALGRNYRFLEQYDKAIEEFNRANALNPTDPMPNTYISRTYATVGEFAKAIQFAQQAIKVSSKDPYLYGNLGQMYYKNREYKNAITALRLAVRGGTTANGDAVTGLPLDYGRVAEYYYTYGLALAREGECGEALQISRIILQGVESDETSVYNAQEVIRICKDIATSGTPTALPGDIPTEMTSPTQEATKSP